MADIIKDDTALTAAATRWGIVGSGHISNDFCRALETLPETEHKIVAVAAREQEDADRFAKRFNVCKAYSSYESIATDPDVDVVYIGVIHPRHADISIMMLRAGKHVLCEKPMAMSAAQAKTVLDVAKETKKLFVEGIWSRFFPVYDQLRTELSMKTIGEVKSLSVHFGFKFDMVKKPRIHEKELGGGSTLDIGIYAVQLANLVFNMEKPEKIFVHGYLNPSGTDLTFSATLFYTNERMAQFFIAGDCVLSNSATVYGTNGMLEIPMFWCPAELKTPVKSFQFPLPATRVETGFKNSAGFVYEIKAIRNAVLQGLTEVPQVSHHDSLLVADILDEFLRQLGVSYDS